MYEITYYDGTKEKIDADYVWQYYFYPAGDINPTLKFGGTGCELEYLVKSLLEHKPIILSNKHGERDVNKVINTEHIRYIRPS